MHLAELKQAGVLVPPGFVVTTDAYCAFMEMNELCAPAGDGASQHCELVDRSGKCDHWRPIVEMDKLARSARNDPQVAQTSRDTPVELLAARLQESEAGRAFWEEFQDFVRRFRFLAEIDEDFALPRYDEDATIPLRVLIASLEDRGDESLHDGKAVREREQEHSGRMLRFFRKHLFSHLLHSETRVVDLLAALQFDEQLATVRRYTWWREETRELVARAHYLCHRFFWELGRRWAACGVLDQPEDVFLLSWRKEASCLTVL
ncbi:MAG: hypothetical protein M1132_13750 [Chloroflexi bacterium]|nr:hypothetical protein [Chloroflexota bacterium]